LRRLLAGGRHAEVWCAVNRRDVPVEHERLRRVGLRLDNDFTLDEIPAPLDEVIHFAGVTHAHDERRYWDVNWRGTLRLAELARARGCRRFVYVSTRCATEGSGAYGESKLAAERGLLSLDWQSLLILRPSEVYGAGGREGVDKLLELARRARVVPLLWGHVGLEFAPLRADDFVEAVSALLSERREGVRIIELCGPESLSGAALARRIARRYGALPLPVWWPALSLALRAAARLGISPVKPDQIKRLVGRKTASRSTPDPALEPLRASRFLRD
jgi:nucleoside-diphosphate-sugar epimerase